MSTPLANLDAKIAKLEDAAELVEAATRAANEATRSLRQAEKDVRQLLTTEARSLVMDRMDEEIARGLAEYGETIRNAMDAAVAKVGREFDKLAAIYMKDDDDESIHDLALRRKRAHA